ALIQNGRPIPDLDEVGHELGMTLHEIKETTDEPAPPPQEAAAAPSDAVALDRSPRAGESARATVKEIVKRVQPQVEQAFRSGNFGADTSLSMGFKRRMESAINADGVQGSRAATD